jgi:hypothetical protein|tara:strand:- start:480 stop:614 length:135 start_codon:yes stop_codon:yes gene_type:complete
MEVSETYWVKVACSNSSEVDQNLVQINSPVFHDVAFFNLKYMLA